MRLFSSAIYSIIFFFPKTKPSLTVFSASHSTIACHFRNNRVEARFSFSARYSTKEQSSIFQKSSASTWGPRLNSNFLPESSSPSSASTWHLYLNPFLCRTSLAAAPNLELIFCLNLTSASDSFRPWYQLSRCTPIQCRFDNQHPRVFLGLLMDLPRLG